MKHYTSIEQSKKLLELGLNPNTADMYYFLDPTPVGNIYIPSLIIAEKHLKGRMPEYGKGDIPCWSIGALLEVISKKEFPTINLNCDYNGPRAGIYEWQADCCHGTGELSENLIDAVYSMVVDYLKTIKL